MRIEMTLTEKDMSAAVAVWLKSKGFRLVGEATFTFEKGDRPHDSDTFSASATVEQIPPGDPQR